MNCYYCSRYFRKKRMAIEHLNKVHVAQLEADGLDAAQACYLTTHPSLHGVCTCCDECREPTEWNFRTGKPYRISPKPECRARNTARAQENLMNARGIDHHTLMTDMQHQKDLRRRKHTSGKYRFKTDGGCIEYESQLDRNFLVFCDVVLNLPTFAIMDPPECFPYIDTKTNTERYYTPDYYLPDYNLLVEIKEGGDHPNTNPAYIRETKYKVALKDEAMRKQTKYNFIRISGANYGPFVEMLYNIVHQEVHHEKSSKPMVVITEAACADQNDWYKADTDEERIDPDNIRLIVGYMDIGLSAIYVGITDSPSLTTWYLSDYSTNMLYYTNFQDPVFKNARAYHIYKYIGPAEDIHNVFHLIMHQVAGIETHTMTDILQILDSSNIWFDDGVGLTTNPYHRSNFILIEEGYTNGD